MNDSISVIVPVYNAKAYLESCVTSVLRQTYAPVEVVLVDDGSTDGSAEMCDRLAAAHASVQVVHQANAGVSAARNAGFKAARGDWVTFVDADDQLLPNALQTLSGAIEPSIDGICGGILQGAQKARAGRPAQRYLGETQVNKALVALLNNPTQYLTSHAWLLRASALAQLDVAFRTDLKYGEDGEMMLRSVRSMRGAVLLSEPVYRYRLTTTSAVHRYREDVVAQYLRTLGVVWAARALYGGGEAVAPYTLTHLLLILTHCVFHPDNGQTLSASIKKARLLCEAPIFQEAFAVADLSGMGFARRLLLNMLRRGWLFPVWIAVRIRQLRNRRISRATAE